MALSDSLLSQAGQIRQNRYIALQRGRDYQSEAALSQQQFTQQLRAADLQAIRQKAALNAAKFAQMEHQQLQGRAVTWGATNPDAPLNMLPVDLQPYSQEALAAQHTVKGEKAAAEKAVEAAQASADEDAAMRILNGRMPSEVPATEIATMPFKVQKWILGQKAMQGRYDATAAAVQGRFDTRMEWNKQTHADALASAAAAAGRATELVNLGKRREARLELDQGLKTIRGEVRKFEDLMGMRMKYESVDPTTNALVTTYKVDPSVLKTKEGRDAYAALVAQEDALEAQARGVQGPPPEQTDNPRLKELREKVGNGTATPAEAQEYLDLTKK